MASLSIGYTFQGKVSAWFVGIIFVLVGVGAGIILPEFLTPNEPEHPLRVEGTVSAYDFSNDDSMNPVFAYTLPDGTEHTYESPIGSTPPIYALGERVILIIDQDHPQNVYVEGDRALTMAILILRILAGVFFVIGSVTIVLLLRGADALVVHRVGGLLGALSFGIPASFALPGLWLAYQSRPNILFREDSVFGQEFLLIGAMFTVFGIISTIGAVLMYRFQMRTGQPGWSWTWQSDEKKLEPPKAP